jgi:competence protein ComEA
MRAFILLCALLCLPLSAHAAETSPVSPSGVVNINNATAEQLERLPGVGPSRAEAIVELRRTHPFKKVDELSKVKGIGRKTLAKMRGYLTVLGPTTLEHSAKHNR